MLFLTDKVNIHFYIYLIDVSNKIQLTLWYSVVVPEKVKQQYSDNIRWIKEAGKHKMVGGVSPLIIKHWLLWVWPEMILLYDCSE